MKDHIKNEHGDEYYIINHSKQSRADSEEIDMVQYSKAFFLTNYWTQLKWTNNIQKTKQVQIHNKGLGVLEVEYIQKVDF